MLEAVVNAGPVLSWMMKDALVLEELPEASVAVKVTKVDPPKPQPLFTSASKSSDQLTPEQLSEADAPAWLASQAFSSALLPAPSHSAS